MRRTVTVMVLCARPTQLGMPGVYRACQATGSGRAPQGFHWSQFRLRPHAFTGTILNCEPGSLSELGPGPGRSGKKYLAGPSQGCQ